MKEYHVELVLYEVDTESGSHVSQDETISRDFRDIELAEEFFWNLKDAIHALKRSTLIRGVAWDAILEDPDAIEEGTEG